MKALVYHGPGQKALDDRPAPVLQQATEAVVRVTGTTICDTDLLNNLKAHKTSGRAGR